MLSIIIPTFNERENVIKISTYINKILNDFDYELVFVDDSTDDTPDFLERLAKQDAEIKFIHRTNERGLGSAVVEGFKIANGDIFAVIDADLQHPPELLLPMFQAISLDADVVIPSRFVPGGDDGGLNYLRKLISFGARNLGKVFLKTLRPISDATSGYFMFRKKVIDGIDLKPIGWKILIEILIKGHYKKVVEIPYKFRSRTIGQSKMCFQEQWNYIKHLMILLSNNPAEGRFFLFGLIGLSGVFVNTLVYTMLVSLNVNIIVSGTLAALVAMLSNFFLNDRYTWIEVKKINLYFRLTKFITTSVIGIVINIAVLASLYQFLNINYLIANLSGICFGAIWNYFINNIWTWKQTDDENDFVVEQWSMKNLLEVRKNEIYYEKN